MFIVTCLEHKRESNPSQVEAKVHIIQITWCYPETFPLSHVIINTYELVEFKNRQLLRRKKEYRQHLSHLRQKAIGQNITLNKKAIFLLYPGKTGFLFIYRQCM